MRPRPLLVDEDERESSPLTDVVLGIAFNFVVAFVGHALFGDAGDVAIWGVVFFALVGGYVHGYVVASRGGLRVLHDRGSVNVPRRYR